MNIRWDIIIRMVNNICNGDNNIMRIEDFLFKGKKKYNRTIIFDNERTNRD